ncbi:conserved exported hypothetical protein [Candidatus Sulfopaludibacter sp. SbA4]|nr:conserved exported hypothetical protein [Candidatus Sulfopaludibacter sp. SbA4]
MTNRISPVKPQGSAPRTMLLVLLSLLLGTCPPARAQFTQQGNKLLGTGASAQALQGTSVALSADGSTAIVGAPADSPTTTGYTGAAWIYTRNTAVQGAPWVQQGPKLTGPGGVNPRFGQSVALSADGNTALVGGPYDGLIFMNGVYTYANPPQVGAAWVFTRTNGVWSEQAKLVVSDTPFAAPGYTASLSADGNTALLGGQYGPAWVFTRTNAGWKQGPELVPSGYGQGDPLTLSLSADGNTALVGEPGANFNPVSQSGEGGAWVFTQSNGVWSQQGGKLLGTGAVGQAAQGTGVALSADGNTAVIGGPGDSSSSVCMAGMTQYSTAVGAAWVFTRSNGVWSQQGGKLVGTGATGAPAYGFSVAVSGDGNRILLGGPGDAPPPGACPGTGATWVFARRNGVWSQQGAKLAGSGSTSGPVAGSSQGAAEALSADATTALVGGPTDNNGQGAAWVFTQAVATHFAVSAPASATGGTAFNFTVTAQDANNNTFAGYSGTVHFTSTDAAAVLPADTTLTNGTGTFSATLSTGGNQTITATDTVTATITGTSGAIAVTSAVVTPPTPASVNVSNSTYTFVYSDPRGYQDLGVVNILVNNFLDGRHACYLAYVVATNTLVLVDDAGDAGGPYAGSANSQCAVTLVSATGTGNNLTLILTITWTPSFAGDKIIQLAARDAAQNNSGWQPLAVVRVPGGTQTTTTAVVSMSPNRGSGLGPNPFTFNWYDTLGFQDLGVENILVNSSLDGRHACYLAFSRPFNTLYLEDDNGDGLLPGQSLAAGGSLTNSQCTVSWGANPANPTGNNLSLTLNIAFTAAFGGNRIIYLAARDVNEANNTDWHAMGTWTPR